MVDQHSPAAPSRDTAGANAAERAKAGLEYVCAHRDEIREELGHIPPGSATGDPAALLRELTAAVTAVRPYIPALDAIHAALLGAGDALGLYGRVDRWDRNSVFTPAGVPTRIPPPADERIYLCPTGQCPRYALLPDPRPHCAVTDQPFREDHL